MPDQQSILIIFDLLNNSAPVTPAAKKVIENISKTYPYFIPARYIKSLDIYRKEPNSSAINSITFGYSGNWILFNEFLHSTPPTVTGEKENEFDDFGNVRESNVAYEKKKETSIFDEQIDEEKLTLPARKKTTEPYEFKHNTILNEKKIPYIGNVEEVDDAIIEDAVVEEIFDATNNDSIKVINPNDSNYISENIDDTKEKVDDSESLEDNVKNLQAEADALINEFLLKRNKEHEESEKPKPNLESESDLHINETEIVISEICDTPLAVPPVLDDYFIQQGEPLFANINKGLNEITTIDKGVDEDKSLMVMMSFQEWLQHFKKKEESQSQEQEDKKVLKTMWQKEKLAAALEEESDEISEEVFDLAMNSITREDGLASESLAEIYIKQGKYDKAIEMFRKLSLRNPEKNTYFAQKIEEISKEYLS